MPTFTEQLEALKQPFQAYSLVGLYLQQFSIMEAGLGRLMAALLKLSPTQASIVSANMEFSAKAYTCRSLLKIALPEDDEAANTMKTLIDVHAKRRNTFAHSVFFWPVTEPGVRLHKVRAKGTLETQQETVSVEAMLDEAAALMKLTDYFETLTAKIASQTDLLDRIAAAPGIVPRGIGINPSKPWWHGAGLQGQPPTPSPPEPSSPFGIPTLPPAPWREK